MNPCLLPHEAFWWRQVFSDTPLPMMPPDEFEAFVEAAIGDLPSGFLRRLENVDVIVQPEPDPRRLRDARCRPGDTLFGLYIGVPLTERTSDYSGTLPDRIFIFQGPLERAFPDPDDLRRQIRETVVHEVGHFFGLSDREIYRITGEEE